MKRARVCVCVCVCVCVYVCWGEGARTHTHTQAHSLSLSLSLSVSLHNFFLRDDDVGLNVLKYRAVMLGTSYVTEDRKTYKLKNKNKNGYIVLLFHFCSLFFLHFCCWGGGGGYKLDSTEARR